MPDSVLPESETNMADVTPIQFQRYEENNGFLCVFESGQRVPFSICRVFTVSARKGDFRGDHAHKKCTQLLVSLSGKIRVTCDNGSVVSEYLLEGMGSGLLVPPGVWARQEYLMDDAVLMVLCDRGYEVDDYIRDYKDFKAFLGIGESN